MMTGKLIFFCGKMGAGKSTKAREVAVENSAVLLSEDEWLESLYPQEITSLEDYVTYSNRLKPEVKKLVQSILGAGTNVVMDFPANTISQREWFRGIFSGAGSRHELFYLDVSDERCLQQISKRRISQPERARTDTKEMFEKVTRYFVEPHPSEKFNVVVIRANC